MRLFKLVRKWLGPETEAQAKREAAFQKEERLAAHWRWAYEELEQQQQEVLNQNRELTDRNAELNTTQAMLEARYHTLEAARAQWASLATSDGMTGLANHRAFQEELARQRARAERSRAPLSLLLIDVDHFKQYNDAFGHPAGDEVLQGVGALLTDTVREGDFPARYGGEEFAIILPETDIETAMQVGERVRAAVEQQTFPNRAVTVSIGVTQYLRSESTDALIQRADVAMYEAKSAGRNCLSALEPEPLAVSHEEIVEEEKRRNDEETARPNTSYAIHEYQESKGREPFLLDTENIEALAAVTPGWLHWRRLDGGIEGLLQEATAPILSDILAMLDARDDSPPGHSERVARYAIHLGHELAAYYDEQRDVRPLLPRVTSADLLSLAFGALLHDIGKMGISDSILHKTGKLTDEEWRQIRRHPLAGSAMLAPSPLLTRAQPVVRFHHERWDGTGYPQGLAGEDIPLSARIFAVCDTLDILTNSKPYRPALSHAEAREEILRMCGTQFDPDVVKVFLRIPEHAWHLPTAFTALPDTRTDITRAA